MVPVGPSTLVRLRALCAVLFILTAAIAAPAAVATQSADACGMSCCVKEGHCCCSPHHARVKGQVSDEKPQLSEPELSRSCPEGCATPTRTSNQVLRDNRNLGTPGISRERTSEMFFGHLILVRDHVDSGASTPRAPPRFLFS